MTLQIVCDRCLRCTEGGPKGLATRKAEWSAPILYPTAAHNPTILLLRQLPRSTFSTASQICCTENGLARKCMLGMSISRRSCSSA